MINDLQMGDIRIIRFVSSHLLLTRSKMTPQNTNQNEILIQ